MTSLPLPLPMPREILLTGGVCLLGDRCLIVLDSPDPQALLFSASPASEPACRRLPLVGDRGLAGGVGGPVRRRPLSRARRPAPPARQRADDHACRRGLWALADTDRDSASADALAKDADRLIDE
jgi:hypothetical protein